MPRATGDSSGLAQERLQILRMVEEQTISPDEASRLMEALERSDRSRVPPPPAPRGPRDVRIRITNTRTTSKDVDIALPINWVESALGLVNRLAPGKLPDFAHILRSVDERYIGHILDIQNGEDHVEIIIEARTPSQTER